MFGRLRIDCPHIVNYDIAKAHEAKIVPLRGRTPECKPLGKRSQDWITIAKNGENIEIQVRGHTAITYLPDGTIKVMVKKYPNDTLNKAIREIIPSTYIYLITHDSKTWAFAKWMEGDTLKCGYLPVDRELVFKQNNDVGLERMILQNPAFPKKHTLNRKKTNEVKKKYGYLPFRQYLSATMRLLGDDTASFFSDEALGEVFGYRKKDNGEPLLSYTGKPVPTYTSRLRWMTKEENHNLLELTKSSDPSDYYKALLMLMRWEEKTEARALRELDRVIYRAHASEVLEVHDVRTGKIFQDTHAGLVW